MPAVEEVRDQALEVAAGWSPAGAPGSWRLTAALFGVIASHEELLGRLAALPADRLPALLASAAISYLVRRDQPAPLAGYFPEPGGPQPGFDDGFPGAARAFVSARLDDIVAECQGRRYQMNEVARCTQIALGLAAAADPAAGPVGLADLGTGAGLGLHLDRYRYRVGGRARGPGRRHDPELRGPRLAETPPAVVPPIAERVGIDRHPLDPRDPAARSWLEACAPPEASGLARLAAALGVARRYPARLVAGDVVTALPAVLESFPPGRRVIVTDSYLAVFLPAPQRAELAAVWPAPRGPARSPGCRWTRWFPSGRPAGTACRASRCPWRWSATTSATGCSPCWGSGRSRTAGISRGCWPGPTRPVHGSSGSPNGRALPARLAPVRLVFPDHVGALADRLDLGAVGDDLRWCGSGGYGAARWPGRGPARWCR